MRIERRDMSERIKGVGIGAILVMVLGVLSTKVFAVMWSAALSMPVIIEQNKVTEKHIVTLNNSLKGVNVFISDHSKDRGEWLAWKAAIDSDIKYIQKHCIKD